MTTALTTQTTLAETMQLGEVLAASGFFTDSRQPAQAVVKVLAGRELGFGPIASMTGIYIVKGKVALSANIMAAAIKHSDRYNYRIKHIDDQSCQIEFFENGQAIGVSIFTIEDAKKAGLTSNSTWQKFPRNMLFARALSNGARWYCPDLSGGPVYTPDELGATVDKDGEIIDMPVTSTNGQQQPSPEPRNSPLMEKPAYLSLPRPWPSEVAIQAIRDRAQHHEAKGNIPVNGQNGKWGALAGWMGNDAATFLQAIFGVTSRKEVTGPQRLALIEWSKIAKHEEEGKWFPCDEAAQEFRQIVKWQELEDQPTPAPEEPAF